MLRGETPRWTDIIPPYPHQLARRPDPLFQSEAGLTTRAPSSSPTDLMTLHASSLNYFQQTAEVAKVCPDRFHV